jgi:pantothenate kinase-related protein Tda10
MVAMVRTPSLGKSISSLLLANELKQQCRLPCMVLPNDSYQYHYALDQLKHQSFPNVDDAIYRHCGVPDTFDPQALKFNLDQMHNNPSVARAKNC